MNVRAAFWYLQVDFLGLERARRMVLICDKRLWCIASIVAEELR